MDNSPPKDDMTRIGSFLRPSGEEEARPAETAPPSPPQPSFPPSPPSQAPVWPPPSLEQGPAPTPPPAFAPPDPAPSFAPPSAGPSFAPSGSGPAVPSPGPSFPSPQPSFSAPQSPPAPQPVPVAPPAFPPAAAPLDDMWFEVEQANPPIEHPLREAQLITVGREASQDIVIMDKTLSRNHLVLERHGDRIAVQVLGLNGLVHAGQVYKSTRMELTAPCALTIGNVTCRIKKKLDSEATILMTDPVAMARQQSGSVGAAPMRPAPAEPRTAPPVWPPPEDRGPFAPEQQSPPFPASQPSSPAFTSGRAETRFPGAAPAPPAHAVREPVFPGQAGASGPFAGGGTPPPPGRGIGANNRQLLLYGGLGLGLLLVAGIGLFLWLRSPAPPPAQPGQPPQPQATQAPPATPPPQAQQAEPQGQASSLHSHYLGKAKSYLAEGKPLDACDYLKDIPPTSPLRSEAAELAKQIPGCSL